MITCFSMRPFRAQESAPDMARRAPKTVCPDAGVPDGREEEYLANDTAEGLVQRMRAAFPSFETFSFITRSGSCSRSRRTSGRNQPSPKDPGGIGESIDLSRNR